jgi:predicted aspartyl protease
MKFPYDTDYFPPAPSVEIQLSVPDESFAVGPLQALVDTGADASIVPTQYIRSLKVQVDNRKYLCSQWGERRLIDTYLLDVGIGGLRLPLVEIVANEWGKEVILGRNVLNKLAVMLDGPKQVLEILD